VNDAPRGGRSGNGGDDATTRRDRGPVAPASPAAGIRLLSGTDALVQLMLRQHAIDRAAGLRTEGFVSGYRGSPLAGVDLAMWRARSRLDAAAIRFEPGLNEELAATAVWGTQQVDGFGAPRCDGVFALWYGKNPGLDRIGDVLKHANMDGTASRGGVLVATGDDPGASSSTIANQGEQALIAALSPVLYPCSVGDIVELGLAGIALSRWCGLWVGLKLVADVVESSAPLPLAGAPTRFMLPADFERPAGGLNRRFPDDRWAQDERTLRFRLPAAQAFARANRLDRTLVAPLGDKRIAFLAAGKALNDLGEAFAILGFGAGELSRLGIGVRRIALVWPFEDRDNAAFLRGFEEVVVVEEKRAVVEPQLKAMAYHWPAPERPRVCGKHDPQGRPLLPEHGELGPMAVARVVLDRLAASALVPSERLEALRLRLARTCSQQVPRASPLRVPHFCAGCPHARSTRLPEGSRALAGIGCHSMAMWVPESRTATLTQMGGEGANWIGAAPYVDTTHVFQNLGDGTFAHSGILAIRAALAARVPITYKILVNSAVAMTGGQPVEGAPNAERIAWQLHAEGVGRIAVVRGRGAILPRAEPRLPPGTEAADRDELGALMRSFREYRGVSAIVYDQICATEKRRLVRRGAGFGSEPVVTIHERVCEGCGDCSAKSHCGALRRVDTPFGSKRRIDASSCNTDLSCLDGFCPSFVTLEGARRDREDRPALPADALAALTEPPRAPLPADRPFGIVLAGVGGSGLVTAGAVIAAAAAIEGLDVTQLDNTGLARKGGEVSTYLRVGASHALARSTRIPEGSADLLIAGDLATAASRAVVGRLSADARAVLSTEAAPMLEQAIDPEQPLPVDDYRRLIDQRLAGGHTSAIDAPSIARHALGDAIYANMVLVGAASQHGHLPVGRTAIEDAIRAQGVSVQANLDAFAWGRLAAAEPELTARLCAAQDSAAPAGHDALVAYFASELERYQDRRLAQRYSALAGRVATAEHAVQGRVGALAASVARNAFRALAIKDEYEVARLVTDRDYLDDLRRRYGDDVRPVFHFAPAWLPGRRSTSDGRRAKRSFGPWIVVPLRALAALRFLRNTSLDPFAHQAERVEQRRFTERYCAGLDAVAASLSIGNMDAALEFARLPENVRGYGHVRMPALREAQQAIDRLLPRFSASPSSSTNGSGP